MTDTRTHLLDHLADGAKATPAVTFWATWFWGVNWSAVSAFLMAVYTLVLLLDKFGLLTPIKTWCGGVWRRAFNHGPP